MTRDGAGDRERIHRLMMAALDGEISESERRDLESALEEDPALGKEWKTMTRVKEVTGEIGWPDPPEEVWDRYWESVYNRTERGIGWISLSVGVIIVLAFGAWSFLEELLRDSSAPWFLRGAIFMMAFGLVVLAVSVIRERVFTRKSDPYREVKR